MRPAVLPRLLPASGYRRMRWKNGGGETTEILIEPPAATLDGFDWRLSMARVESAGPFSIFAGVDRSLVLLEGEGLRFHPVGRGETILDRQTPPIEFPADVAVEAAPIGGPVLDFNVMSRRSRCRHHLWRVELASRSTLTPCGATTVATVWGGGAAFRGQDWQVATEAGDSLHWEGPASVPIEVEPTAPLTLLVVEFSPVQPPG